MDVIFFSSQREMHFLQQKVPYGWVQLTQWWVAVPTLRTTQGQLHPTHRAALHADQFLAKVSQLGIAAASFYSFANANISNRKSKGPKTTFSYYTQDDCMKFNFRSYCG